MKDIEAFEAWWIAQETGLGTAHKFAAWNAWLARAAVEADRAQRVPDVEAHDELMALAERIEEARGRSICVMPEFAKVLRTLLASTPAPAQQEPSEPWSIRMARLEIETEASMEAGAAHQEPPQQERKPMTEIVRQALLLTAWIPGNAGKKAAEMRRAANVLFGEELVDQAIATTESRSEPC